MGELNKEIKLSIPEKFNGNKSKFKGFLVQKDLYLTFHSTRFRSETERVLWMITLLEGEALGWVEGFL